MSLPPLKPNSQGGRLLKALVLGWPRFVGGQRAFGDLWHKASTRLGDTLAPRGFETVGHKCPRSEGNHQVYRFASEAIYREAALLTRSWQTGENIDELRRHVRSETPMPEFDQGRLSL